MAMFRRSRKPAPPLHRKQQEIAQQEAQLREKVESLERIVIQSRAPAQKKIFSARAGPQANKQYRRKAISCVDRDGDPQALDTEQSHQRHRALRKERRQGRIVFLILLAALGVVVMLLISHLHP